jgi:antitoxin YefM
MEAITSAGFRKNFNQVMDRVCEDHVPLIVTQQNQNHVVVLSLSDYNAIKERVNRACGSSTPLSLLNF